MSTLQKILFVAEQTRGCISQFTWNYTSTTRLKNWKYGGRVDVSQLQFLFSFCFFFFDFFLCYVPSARYLYTSNTATELGIANGVEGTAVGIVLDEREPACIFDLVPAYYRKQC